MLQEWWSERIRSIAALSGMAAATLLLASCAVPALVGTSQSPSPQARVSPTCIPPTPRSTFVPAPTSSDSTPAYNTAVASAALDDAMANARAQSEYQQCLSRIDSL